MRNNSVADCRHCGWLTQLFAIIVLALIGAAAANSVTAQQGLDSSFNQTFGSGISFGALGQSQADEPSSWNASYALDSSGTSGTLSVTVTLGDRWHVYSVTQPSGGPTPTNLTISAPTTVKLADEFKPNQAPSKSESPIYKGVTIEEHSDEVSWAAPIDVPSGFRGVIEVSVNALVCKSGDGRCIPFNETIRAKLDASGIASQPSMVSESVKPSSFRDNDYVVAWTAELSDNVLGAGEKALLKFTASPDLGYHVYHAVTDDSESATNFVVTDKAGLRLGSPTADKKVKSQIIAPSFPPVEYYDGKVSWVIPIEVPADAKLGKRSLTGLIAYQACTDNSCQRPMALKFSVDMDVVDASTASDAAGAVTLASSKYSTALKTAKSTDWVDKGVSVELQSNNTTPKPDRMVKSVGGFGAGLPSMTLPPSDQQQVAVAPVPESVPEAEDIDAKRSQLEDQAEVKAGGSGLGFVLLSALLGGFVLNFMPCVLPVIGLKVMSFVSQGGEDKRRVLNLNLAYVAGIFSVFGILGLLAIVFSFGWGQQFQYFPVRLGVTIGLFAFALSYFNVWEIPVPGLAAGKTSQELQSQEGLAGAFSKGIFTTLLATPCSGPLLGGVFGATLGMPAFQTALVFAMLGLGMSLPYLAIGFKPELARFLPKPGPWMETFKQLMAFLFLAAVAYFFYQFSDENKFPVFVVLMGVWFGCWIIGRVPNWASIEKRLVAWMGGVGVASAIGVFAFSTLKAPPELQWVDYDPDRLAQYQAEGKTVLVDFSAKWCVNCLVNLETAIDTEKTKRVVDKNGVIAMYADWTNNDPDITAKLKELNSNSIPVLAIYPSGRPYDPIVLRDLVSQSTVINALEQAGPSRASSSMATREDDGFDLNLASIAR